MVLSFESEGPETSDIEQYYAGTTVFLTGGTGFLGKLLLEKLLRTCSDVTRIYMLIREKKGKSVEKRFEEMLDNVFFESVRREQPKFADKITLISGDCSTPELGIIEKDRHKLVNEVNCVFHCAATVRFNERLQTAAYTNVKATRDILIMAKQMKHLKSFIYVSTAYSNCVRKDIGEKFYEAPMSGEKFLALADAVDPNLLDDITPHVIGNWPNTYAFSKAMAEDIVKTYGKGLPVAVVRPSIVVATFKEPLQGWIDNIYGATGALLGGSLGLVRTMNLQKECLADLVPADFVINCAIVAAWDAGKDENPNLHKEGKNEKDIAIYNYVCSVERPLTWRQCLYLAEKHAMPLKTPLLVWYPFFFIVANRWLYLMALLFLHTIPAYIVDFLAHCLGKPRLLVKGYQKINKFLDVLAYFATRQWDFKNNNTQALWKKLNNVDRKSFDFDMHALQWETFFSRYAVGARVYLLKDPLETIPKGQTKYRNLAIAHYTLVALLLLGLYKLIMFTWRLF